MDFRLSDTQQGYVDTVKKFVKNEISPSVMALDKKHEFPRNIFDKAWELGFMNLCIPESVKGYEVDVVSSALIIKELSYGDTGISTSAMCNDLANSVIAQHGSDEQRERFLKPFVEKPAFASFCLTEPGAGSDNSSMTTFIKKREQGGYVLNGAKCFITNASYADQFSVFCKVGKPSGSFMGCVIVPCPPEMKVAPDAKIRESREITMPGGGKIVIGKPEEKLGQTLSNTATVTFEDVIIGDDQVIGDRRRGFQYVIDVLDYARPMVAAIAVGLAKRAFDVTLEYTRERKQFGQAIGEFQLMQGKVADMYSTWQATRAYVYAVGRACDVSDYSRTLRKDAAGAILYSAEKATWMAGEAIQTLGGVGYTNEYPVGRLWRDAKLYEIGAGTSEIRRMLIGRELFAETA